MSRIHVPLESIPSRVFTSSRPSDPLGPEPTPTRSLAPSTASPGLAPRATGRSAPAAVRSRVFSTPQRFASTPGLRGLVSCRSHPWGSSLRSLAPRRGRAPLSGPLAPLRFSIGRHCARDRARPAAPGFADAHAVRRGCLAPHRSIQRRFSRPCGRPPRRLGSSANASVGRRHRPRPLRSLLPSTKPYRSAGEAATTALAPLGLRPSRAFLRSSLGPFDPADHSVHRGLAPATTKEAIPRRQVRTRDLAAARPRRRVDPRSDRRPARATSRRQPSLPRPWRPATEAAGCVTLGGVKDSISGPSP